MAFNAANLTLTGVLPGSLGSYAHIWDYTTADNFAAVTGSNYLDTSDAAKMFRTGDFFRFVASDGKGAGFVTQSGSPSTPDINLSEIMEIV